MTWYVNTEGKKFKYLFESDRGDDVYVDEDYEVHYNVDDLKIATIPFSLVKFGECFSHDGTEFFKITTNTAIDENWNPLQFFQDCMVTPVLSRELAMVGT